MAHGFAIALQQASRIRQRCAVKELHVDVRGEYSDIAEGSISLTYKRRHDRDPMYRVSFLPVARIWFVLTPRDPERVQLFERYPSPPFVLGHEVDRRGTGAVRDNGPLN